MCSWLDRYFNITGSQSTLAREFIAGLTTFVTLAYIVAVNPLLLQKIGMDQGAVFTATCLAGALGSLLMGIGANYPIALAPSMGLNAFFTFVVVKDYGFSWQVALSMVFIAGMLFLLATISGVRQMLLYQLPQAFKIAITAGIGLFLGIIALTNLGFMDAPNVFKIHLSVLKDMPVWLALGGLALIILLSRLQVFGATLIGMIILTIIGISLGMAHFQGIIEIPPSLAPTLNQLQFPAFNSLRTFEVIITFFFVALFDCTGTLIGVLHHGNIPINPADKQRVNRSFYADATATVAGAYLGTSTVGSYIESAAGVQAGGRTGLSAVIVSILFILTLFFAPLAKSVPSFATASVLLFVACMMMTTLKAINWRNMTEVVPTVAIFLGIPVTFSIAEGIGLGFISYTLLKLVTGRIRELSAFMWILTLFFIGYLIMSWFY